MAVAPAGNDVSGGPLHALRVKIREDVVVGLALGALCDGTRNILGLGIETTEGAKFGMKVFNDLKDRDVADILIVVTDGFEGHAEALEAAIRPTYTEPSTEAALPKLGAFAQGLWGVKFPTVAAAWRRAGDKVIPFFAFPAPIRRVVYTTNAIESVNARLRKIITTRGHFPSGDTATKLIWLTLRNIAADWGRAAKDWKEAMNQFSTLYAERFQTARG